MRIVVQFITAVLVHRCFLSIRNPGFSIGFSMAKAFSPWYESCKMYRNNVLTFAGSTRRFSAAEAWKDDPRTLFMSPTLTFLAVISLTSINRRWKRYVDAGVA